MSENRFKVEDQIYYFNPKTKDTVPAHVTDTKVRPDGILWLRINDGELFKKDYWVLAYRCELQVRGE